MFKEGIKNSKNMDGLKSATGGSKRNRKSDEYHNN